MGTTVAVWDNGVVRRKWDTPVSVPAKRAYDGYWFSVLSFIATLNLNWYRSRKLIMIYRCCCERLTLDLM